MTISPDAPRLVVGDLAEAIRSLRAAGMRVSTARRLVLEALFAAPGPVSAAHLARELSIDESSVYRNLEMFEQHGLIHHVHLGHGPGLYVLVGRDEVEYLYCERCARTTMVTPDQLDPVRRQIQEQFAHAARFTHFAMVGLCEQCLARPLPESVADDASRGEPHGHHHHDRADVDPGEATDHDHAHSHGGYVHTHRQGHEPYPDRRTR